MACSKSLRFAKISKRKDFTMPTQKTVHRDSVGPVHRNHAESVLHRCAENNYRRDFAMGSRNSCGAAAIMPTSEIFAFRKDFAILGIQGPTGSCDGGVGVPPAESCSSSMVPRGQQEFSARLNFSGRLGWYFRNLCAQRFRKTQRFRCLLAKNQILTKRAQGFFLYSQHYRFML